MNTVLRGAAAGSGNGIYEVRSGEMLMGDVVEDRSFRCSTPEEEEQPLIVEHGHCCVHRTSVSDQIGRLRQRDPLGAAVLLSPFIDQAG